VCQSALCKKAVEVGHARLVLFYSAILQSRKCDLRVERPGKIPYSREGIYNSKKTYQLDKGDNLNVLCFQALNLAPKIGRPRSATRCWIAVATRQVGK